MERIVLVRNVIKVYMMFSQQTRLHTQNYGHSVASMMLLQVIVKQSY